MKNGELVMLLAPVLTPHGVLTLRRSGDVASLDPDLGARLEKAFAKGPGHGLLCLGADEIGTVLPPVLSYWREFGGRYVTALCALHGIGEGRTKPPVPAPANSELEQMAFAVPAMLHPAKYFSGIAQLASRPVPLFIHIRRLLRSNASPAASQPASEFAIPHNRKVLVFDVAVGVSRARGGPECRACHSLAAAKARAAAAESASTEGMSSAEAAAVPRCAK